MKRGVLPAVASLLATALVLAGCASGGAGLGSFGGEGQTYGQRLLLRRCQNCHAAPAPAGMTAEKWDRGLARMRKRMHLPASDWDTLAAMGPPPIHPDSQSARQDSSGLNPGQRR